MEEIMQLAKPDPRFSRFYATEKKRLEEAEKKNTAAGLEMGKKSLDMFPSKLPIGSGGEIPRPFPQ